MSPVRVAVLAGLVLAIAAPAAADSTRFAIAVVGDGVDTVGDEAAGTSHGAASRRAAASIRDALADRGLEAISPGAPRDALEGPVPPGDADAALSRASKQLGAAREAYAGFEYERALAALDEIDRRLVDREPTPAALELLVERHLLAGVVHEGRGRPTDARRSFRVVRHLDPDRRALDAGAYRPQVVALFARVARASERRAPLRVDAQPAGARVWIDGRDAGAAPVVRDDLAAGAHWVVAAAPGHRARGALVELDPDGPTSARLSLVLPARAPAERIGELRRQLGGATGDDARRAAGELARLAGAAVLVLVRERGDRTEGASFDARTGALSAWQPAPSDAFTRQIAGGPVPLAPAPAAGAPLLLGGSTDGEPDRDPSWYGTWWGRTLLVAGGVVIAGAVVYAVTSGRDGDYAVGGFCFDGVDC